MTHSPQAEAERRSIPITPDMFKTASAVMTFLAAQAQTTDLTIKRKDADNGHRSSNR
jgi:hypothetical protein